MRAIGRRGGIWAIVVAVVVVGLLTTAAMMASGGASSGTPASATNEDGRFGLFVDDRKDGDSFVASDGVEYRVGMINTPELSECGGTQAADVTYAFLDNGFSAVGYARDDYGRTVARIMTADGDLGVMLAQTGFANDRYLAQNRDQNPAYATKLDSAFRTAEQNVAGLWTSCWPSEDLALPEEPPATTGNEHAGHTGVWACHVAYTECLPDGPDLDCSDVGHQVGLRSKSDPYRLDGNSIVATDGVGCDTYEPWMKEAVYNYYLAGP